MPSLLTRHRRAVRGRAPLPVDNPRPPRNQQVMSLEGFPRVRRLEGCRVYRDCPCWSCDQQNLILFDTNELGKVKSGNSSGAFLHLKPETLIPKP